MSGNLITHWDSSPLRQAKGTVSCELSGPLLRIQQQHRLGSSPPTNWVGSNPTTGNSTPTGYTPGRYSAPPGHFTEPSSSSRGSDSPRPPHPEKRKTPPTPSPPPPPAKAAKCYIPPPRYSRTPEHSDSSRGSDSPNPPSCPPLGTKRKTSPAPSPPPAKAANPKESIPQSQEQRSSNWTLARKLAVQASLKKACPKEPAMGAASSHAATQNKSYSAEQSQRGQALKVCADAMKAQSHDGAASKEGFPGVKNAATEKSKGAQVPARMPGQPGPGAPMVPQSVCGTDIRELSQAGKPVGMLGGTTHATNWASIRAAVTLLESMTLGCIWLAICCGRAATS